MIRGQNLALHNSPVNWLVKGLKIVDIVFIVSFAVVSLDSERCSSYVLEEMVT